MRHISRLTAAAMFSLCTLCTPVIAEITPSVSPNDDRVRKVMYSDGQVFRIDVKVLNATTIVFESGEVVENIGLGDQVGFTAGQLGSNSISVKPTQPGVTGNMAVATNKRTYIFDLVEGTSNPMYLVEFDYPTSKSRTVSAVRPPSAASRTYFVEEKSRATGFMPMHIWDDGTKTYFRFSSQSALPAAFRADGNGREYSVQTKVENGVMIIPSVSDRWVLRLGDSVICIWSDRLRAALANQKSRPRQAAER